APHRLARLVVLLRARRPHALALLELPLVRVTLGHVRRGLAGHELGGRAGFAGERAGPVEPPRRHHEPRARPVAYPVILAPRHPIDQRRGLLGLHEVLELRARQAPPELTPLAHDRVKPDRVARQLLALALLLPREPQVSELALVLLDPTDHGEDARVERK